MAAAHALGECRPNDLYGGGAGLTDGERATAALAAARSVLAAWRGVLVGDLATQVRVGDRLALLDSDLTDELLVRAAELTYTHNGRDSFALAVEAVPPGPLGGFAMAAVPGPAVAVFGTVLDSTDTAGRGWVWVRFAWHEPGDGMWCPVAQATAAKPGHGAVEVPGSGKPSLPASIRLGSTRRRWSARSTAGRPPQTPGGCCTSRPTCCSRWTTRPGRSPGKGRRSGSTAR